MTLSCTADKCGAKAPDQFGFAQLDVRPEPTCQSSAKRTWFSTRVSESQTNTHFMRWRSTSTAKPSPQHCGPWIHAHDHGPSPTTLRYPCRSLSKPQAGPELLHALTDIAHAACISRYDAFALLPPTGPIIDRLAPDHEIKPRVVAWGLGKPASLLQISAATGALPRRSIAASSSTCCPAASIASATMACSPADRVPTTSRKPASYSTCLLPKHNPPIQMPPRPMIRPHSRSPVHAAAAA